MALRSVKGIAPTGRGGANTLFTAFSPHSMMRQGFDLEMEGRHVGVEQGTDEVVWVGAGFGAMLGPRGRGSLIPHAWFAETWAH
jgi:hypothetical protein